MPLNLSAAGGETEYLPILKYNAKSGRWYIREEGEDREVRDLHAVFDLPTIRTGWLHFSESGPDFVNDPSLEQEAPQPSPQHKRAFKCNVYSEKQLGGTREWMSNSMMSAGAMRGLYAAWEEQGDLEKVPVVSCKEAKPVAGKHGTNYEPVLTIEKLIARPAALAKTSPPAPKAAPAKPAKQDDDEF